MSTAERSTKVIGLFEHHRDKRWQNGIAKLVEAYSTLMDAEELILHALLEFGWNERNMTEYEEGVARKLQARAQAIQKLRDSLLELAQQAATEGVYEDWSSLLSALPASEGGSEG